MSVPPPNERPAFLPAEFARAHRVVPLSSHEGRLEIGVCSPPGAALLREIAFLTGKKIVPVNLSPDEVDRFLRACYPAPDPTPQPPARVPAGAGSVVRQVDGLLQEAVRLGASDIHLEPYEHRFRVRYRLDGVLYTAGELALAQRDEILSRVKLMAGLDIAEKRRPQDGRIRITRDAHPIDVRVSTLPAGSGEKIVLRLLDRRAGRLSLEAAGFEADALVRFRRAIHLPYGMVLVTGPTGSGKTTTLYAALAERNTEAVNITTIEDPIEYELPGVNQTAVRADLGFTFAGALRAFLRQDPDVIMVGEIRDTETAEIAVRAALTGHLVFSTLHTNDAPSTVSRLLDMGVEPFLVASSLRLVVAQRLVRRICPDCKTRADPAAAVRTALGPGLDETVLVRGAGCAVCNHTGYRGRTGLFEALPISEETATLIGRRANLHELRAQANREGLRTLRMHALDLLRAGITTPEEVLRLTSG